MRLIRWGLGLVGVALWAMTGAALAQTEADPLPKGTITIVVPLAPAGPATAKQLPEVWTEEGAEDPVAVAAEVGYGKSGALSANSIDPPAAAAVAASGPPAAAAVAASGGVQPAGGNKGRGRREEVSGVGRYPGMDTPLPPLPPPPPTPRASAAR